MRSLGWRVAAVFVVAVAVISSGLALVREGLEIDGDVLALAQYGPALAALVTWLVFRRRLGDMMPAAVSTRQVRAHLALAVAACALFALLLWFGYAVVGGNETFGIRAVGGTPFAVIAAIWLFGATAEEVGWRGVLQPSLESVLPRWGAGILTGLLWSVWHLPLFADGAAIGAVFIASTTVLAVLMAYLGNGSPRQRVITTSVVHWLVNLAILAVAGTNIALSELLPELAAISITTLVFLALFARARSARAAAAAHPSTSAAHT
ncbi:MAG: CPBP family intramembrane glutamic endopeptidase [Ornithinibacter sp.]